jgi:hypothetical protein
MRRPLLTEASNKKMRARMSRCRMAIRKSMVKSVDRMPHPRDKRPLQVLTRSGRYPGWRKCRFTFPRGMAMQWSFEAGFTARSSLNPA